MYGMGWTEANLPIWVKIEFQGPPTCSITPDELKINVIGNLKLESSPSSKQPTTKPLSLTFNCLFTGNVSFSPDGSKLIFQITAIDVSGVDGISFLIVNKLAEKVMKKTSPETCV